MLVLLLCKDFMILTNNRIMRKVSNLSVSCKNIRRKKYGFSFKIQIPLSTITVLKVSIPLDITLSFKELGVNTVSTASCSSLEIIHNKVEVDSILPQGACTVLFQLGYIAT